MAHGKQIELQFSAPNLITSLALTLQSLSDFSHSRDPFINVLIFTHPASRLVVQRPRNIDSARHVFHREGSSEISPRYLITNSRGCN